jgi:hypothetical protein
LVRGSSSTPVKKRIIIVLGVVAATAMIAAVAFGALFFTSDSGSEATGAEQCEHDTFGHIGSLSLIDGRYEMRFDPAWFTSGETANKAAAEDGVVAPGEPVPNDNYRVEEGHRLLTYLVPPDADVTVLTNNGTGIMSTPITVSELAQLVKGEKPIELFEPLDTGFWMRYHVDTVCSLDQQYLP